MNIVKASMEKLNIGFKSADKIWEKRKKIAQITTGSNELDDIMNGGVETGSLTEFYGEFRTGKTQLMHQLCVNVQLPKSKGGLSGGALGGMRSSAQNRQAEQQRQQWEQQQANQYMQKRNSYNRAYSACLEGRGYSVK